MKTRLLWIEATLETTGAVQPNKMKDVFGIGPAMVTRTMAAYRRLKPKALIFDPSIRKYVKSASFKVTMFKSFHEAYDLLESIEDINEHLNSKYCSKAFKKL